MTANVGGPGGLQSEINVTPLVDVVLVLLIIFMVVMPLAVRGYDVAIPGEASEASPAEAPAVPTVLAIDPARCPVVSPPAGDGLPDDCRVEIADATIPVTELSTRVGEIFAGRAVADRVLFLAADDRLNYEAVLRIVDVARSGIDGLRIGLVAGQERSGDDRPGA